MTRRSRAAAVYALAFLSLAACQEQMREGSYVDKLRILGVRAADPELTVAFPHGTDSLPVFTPSRTKLDALVADPAGDGRPVDLTWSVCTVPGIGEDAIEFNCDGENGLPLAAATFSPAVLAGLLAQSDRPADFALPEGFSASLQSGIPVYVWLRVDAGGDTTAGLKRIVISSRENRNRNPVLSGIRVDGENLMDAADLSFKAGRVFEFEPVWDEASLDAYLDEVNGVERTEDPFFSWFATDGEWSAVYTNRNDPGNKWTSPDLDDDAPKTVRMWFVMHDARGGTDWLELKTVRVVP